MFKYSMYKCEKEKKERETTLNCVHTFAFRNHWDIRSKINLDKIYRTYTPCTRMICNDMLLFFFLQFRPVKLLFRIPITMYDFPRINLKRENGRIHNCLIRAGTSSLNHMLKCSKHVSNR